MSVASKNPFALLNDDTVEPVESKPAGKTAAPAATTARTGGDKTRGTRGRGAGPRGGRYYARGGGKPATGDAADSEEPKENSGARFHTGENKEKRGRGRGRGRPYSDRHSRTDIIDSDKQVEAGWGANTGDAELKAETAGEADAEAEATGAGEEAAAETVQKPVEEEDKTITLEEYLSKQVDSLSSLVGSVSVREANEGNESLFDEANKVVKDDEEYFTGKSKGGPKARTERKEKITIEIDGQFSDARERGRGGRGGRGGPRGRGDRGGPRRGRGGRGAGAEVNVDDQNHFPTLGA